MCWQGTRLAHAAQSQCITAPGCFLLAQAPCTRGLDSDTLSFRPCLTEAPSCVQIICRILRNKGLIKSFSPLSFSAEASLQAMRQPCFFHTKCMIACVRITALLLTTAAQQPGAQLPPDTATEQGESVCMVEVTPILFVALRSCLLSLARAVWRAPSHIQGGLLSHMVQRAGR